MRAPSYFDWASRRGGADTVSLDVIDWPDDITVTERAVTGGCTRPRLLEPDEERLLVRLTRANARVVALGRLALAAEARP